jgi:hypothetical protein
MTTQNSISEISFYPCGTEVRIRLLNIIGIISAVIIRYNDVRYEITYYMADGAQTSVNLSQEEFFIDEPKNRTLGFKK